MLKEIIERVFGVFQKIGKALMLPVALLPAAGLLLGLGTMLNNYEFVTHAEFSGMHQIRMLSNIMVVSGEIIFKNLPLIFAVGVAIGLTDDSGVAGLSAIIGFLIMNVTIGSVLNISSKMVTNNPMNTFVLGIPTLQTGVFGGIIIGATSALLYKKFYNIKFNKSLGFFSGNRFVPIITAIVSLIIGFLMALIWPKVQSGLFEFSRSMIGTNQTISAFVFGVVERALIPFGLHHIWYNPFWYQFGEYINSAGQIIIGDQNIFMAQLKDGVEFTAGTFMTGKFPFMMFGLPAVALAMYHEARTERRRLVSGLLVSAALTSFLTGITEPIEFMFMFVAPMLFVVHCILAGISFAIMQILNVKIGLTFSGGVIDFILFGVIPNRTPWWDVIIVGIVFSIIYYVLFRYMIRKMNLNTPGREDDEVKLIADIDEGNLAINTILALGGVANIQYIDACITRLRVTVKDKRKVKKEELKSLGSVGIMSIGENIQLIFGPSVGILCDQIKDIINGKDITVVLESNNLEDIEKANDTGTIIIVPISGEIVPLEEVPDDVFSLKLLGDGFAIEPNENILYSPIEGEVIAILPNKHCITLKSNEGLEVLIHIGIDTVNFKDGDFNAFVNVGDNIIFGQKLIEFPLEIMRNKIKSTLIPVIFMNLGNDEYLYFKVKSKIIAKNSESIRIHRKN